MVYQTAWGTSNYADPWGQPKRPTSSNVASGVAGPGPAKPAWAGSPTPDESQSNSRQMPTDYRQDNNWTPKSDPGAGENYWSQHGSRFTDSNQASQHWNGVSGFFGNPQSSGESAVQGYGQQLGGSRGPLEQLYEQMQGSGAYSKTGAMEDYYRNNSLSGPGFGSTTLRSVSDQFRAGPGAAENYYAKQSDQLTGPSDLDTNQGAIASNINRANNMDRFWGQTAGTLGQRGYTEGMAGAYRPETSYSEQFLTGGGGTEGLDQVYDRLFSKNSRRLDDSAAARGGFNSGAALRATQELGSDLASSQVEAMQAAAREADTAKMARLGFDLDLMQGADSSMRDRIGLGFEGATGADRSGLERAGALQDLYQTTGSERRANLLAGGTLAESAQRGEMDRLKAAGDTARLSDESEVSRYNAGASAADRAQGAERSRYESGINAADRAQSSTLDRLYKAAGLEKDAQGMTMDRMVSGGNLAQGAASQDLANLTAGSAASIAAQQAKERREQGVFDNVRQLGQDQAAAQSSAADKARSEQMAMMMTEIQGLLSQGNLDASSRMELTRLYMQLAQAPVAAFANAANPPTNTGNPSR